jgi:hypothetical protein
MNTPTLPALTSLPDATHQIIGVAVMGFTPFERAALRASLRSGYASAIGLRLVDDMHAADLLVADADLPTVTALIGAAGRIHEAVFIGSQTPLAAMSWMDRPVDARRVIRTLASMADMDFDDVLSPKNSAPGAFAPNTDWASLL